MNRFFTKDDYPRCEEIFKRELETSKNVDPRLYSIILQIYKKEERITSISNLVKKLPRPFQPKIYFELVDSYGQIGYVDKALSFLEQMKSEKQYSENALRVAISIVGNTGNFEKFYEYWKQFPKLKIDRESIAYATAIYASGLIGEWSLMLRFFDEMVNRGFVVQPHTLNSIVSTLAIHAEFSKMDEVLDLWYPRYGITAGPYVYASMISGYLRYGEFDKAQLILQRVKELRFDPTITDQYFLRYFMETDDEESIHSWKNQSAQPYSVSNATFLIPYYLQKGDETEVKNFLQVCPLNCKIYNALIEGSAMIRNWDAMERFIQEMREVGYDLFPKTYRKIVEEYARSGDFDYAMDYWQRALDKGCNPYWDVSMYASKVIVDGLRGNLNSAFEIVNVIKKQGIRLNVLFVKNFLSEVLVRHGLLENGEVDVSWLKGYDRFLRFSEMGDFFRFVDVYRRKIVGSPLERKENNRVLINGDLQ